jgi:hypothetical protein
MNTRVPLAVLLWLGTVALVVVTLAVSNGAEATSTTRVIDLIVRGHPEHWPMEAGSL